jgi:hypothetical protein
MKTRKNGEKPAPAVAARRTTADRKRVVIRKKAVKQ